MMMVAIMAAVAAIMIFLFASNDVHLGCMIKLGLCLKIKFLPILPDSIRSKS